MVVTASTQTQGKVKPSRQYRPRRPTLSQTLGSATYRALYPKKSSKTSISHLEPLEMVWLAQCLKSAKSQYYTENELQKRTIMIISDLPKHMRNPIGNANQYHMTRFFQKIGASADTLPTSSMLCFQHRALSGQLTASARSLLEYCAEDLLYDVKKKIGKTSLQSASQDLCGLIEAAESVMAYALNPSEFEQIYKRPGLDEQTYGSTTICDACVLQKIIGSPDILCGLRGTALYAIRNGLGIDDCGNKRGTPCKLFVEACIATYAHEDAICMLELGDKMAAELERLAKRKPTLQTSTKQGKTSQFSPSNADKARRHNGNTSSGKVAAFPIPAPLNIRRPLKKAQQIVDDDRPKKPSRSRGKLSREVSLKIDVHLPTQERLSRKRSYTTFQEGQCEIPHRQYPDWESKANQDILLDQLGSAGLFNALLSDIMADHMPLTPSSTSSDSGKTPTMISHAVSNAGHAADQRIDKKPRLEQENQTKQATRRTFSMHTTKYDPGIDKINTLDWNVKRARRRCGTIGGQLYTASSP